VFDTEMLNEKENAMQRYVLRGTAVLVQTQSQSSLGTELEWRKIPELLKTQALWNVQRDFLCDHAGIATMSILFHHDTSDIALSAGHSA
jgi:hypothetical protein